MYYTISIGVRVIHQVSMDQPWSPWTVSAPSLMDLQTQTSSVAISAWNSIAMITRMLGQSCRLSSVMPMEITFMDNGGNIFILDEFIE
jgi:hypothetical protein